VAVATTLYASTFQRFIHCGAALTNNAAIGWIFIGPEGLRAGWRFLLFALGIVLGTWFVEEPLANFLAQWFAIPA
jgi:hypothetical protein